MEGLTDGFSVRSLFLGGFFCTFWPSYRILAQYDWKKKNVKKSGHENYLKIEVYLELCRSAIWWWNQDHGKMGKYNESFMELKNDRFTFWHNTNETDQILHFDKMPQTCIYFVCPCQRKVIILFLKKWTRWHSIFMTDNCCQIMTCGKTNILDYMQWCLGVT